MHHLSRDKYPAPDDPHKRAAGETQPKIDLDPARCHSLYFDVRWADSKSSRVSGFVLQRA
jgi:hypothetical protein